LESPFRLGVIIVRVDDDFLLLEVVDDDLVAALAGHGDVVELRLGLELGGLRDRVVVQ